jgi:aminopeptidase N
MRQLERVLGEGNLRDGLRDYLARFQFGNATWLDLVGVLGAKTDIDLAAWSRAWVEEGGRPSIRTEIDREAGRVKRIAFVQSDRDEKRGLVWAQQMSVLVGTAGGARAIPLELTGERADLGDIGGSAQIEFVLPTGGGLAYGDFTLDDGSRAYLLRHIADLPDPVSRGAAWVTLWEELLERRVRPAEFMDRALAALPRETTEQNTQLILGYVRTSFWMFSSPTERKALAPALEQALRAGLKPGRKINLPDPPKLARSVSQNESLRRNRPATFLQNTQGGADHFAGGGGRDQLIRCVEMPPQP